MKSSLLVSYILTHIHCYIVPSFNLQPTSAPVPTNPPTTANPTTANPTDPPTPQPTPSVSFFSFCSTYLYQSLHIYRVLTSVIVPCFPSSPYSPPFSAVVTVSLPLEAVPTVKQTRDAVVTSAGRMELGLACAIKCGPRMKSILISEDILWKENVHQEKEDTARASSIVVLCSLFRLVCRHRKLPPPFCTLLL